MSVVSAATERKEPDMPEMFDWILFAILILPTAFLVWDWRKNR
jgi:hypothetical protein